MFHIIGQLITGLFIGAIARFVIPGVETALPSGLTGWLVTALIGMGGSFIGTFVGKLLWGSEKYAAGWIMSILGAVALLVLFRFLF